MLTNNEYIRAKVMVTILIDSDLRTRGELQFDDINKYLHQSLQLLKLEDRCSKDEYQKMFSDIEYKYKVKHPEGHVIIDDYDNHKDWYVDDENNNHFYWNRYKEYLLKLTNISNSSIARLEESTLPDILNCMSDPNSQNKQWKRGLVIGDVQSGKTSTYTGLICKAADAGYKVVILLAGMTENLRQQTQGRIDEAIVGITKRKPKAKGLPIETLRVGVGMDNKSLPATSYTSYVNDFVGDNDKIATSLESHKSLILFVIKKNVSVLNKLYYWLKEQNLDSVKGYIDVPMLLIDDEADNASVNTKRAETDPTKTNKLIRDICNLFKNSTYVGFTATPYANVFIDPDSVDAMKQSDLFPQDFIYVLNPPTNYIGANEIFLKDSKYCNNLRYISDIEEPDYESEEYDELVNYHEEELNAGTFYFKHKKNWHGILPDSLREAILSFFIANVIRDLRGQSKTHRSMLVNVSRFIKVHRHIAEYISKIHNEVVNAVKFNFSDTQDNSKLPLYQELYQVWLSNYRQITDIQFQRVVQKQSLLRAIEHIKVVVVNGSKLSGALNYQEQESVRVIAVGGLALSRGLTLEGLITSYFYRNTATFDVLMQMGRWFGYRRGYEDLFQIWTTKMSADWYAEVAKAAQELKDDIANMFSQKLTPKDFGIRVRDDNENLQITATNKMRSANVLNERYAFNGNIYDTPYLSKDITFNRINHRIVSELAQLLFDKGYSLNYTDNKYWGQNVYDKNNDKSRYFADVPKNIVVGVLKQIKVSLVNPNFNIDNLLNFLNVADDNHLDLWDIVFEGGEGQLHYDIKGLEMITCLSRSIEKAQSRNVIQISSRRRLLGLREGKFTLSDADIQLAEATCRNNWQKAPENLTPEEAKNRHIPLRAYFECLPERKPILIIMLIDPHVEDSGLEEFKSALANDRIVAFAIGFPGLQEGTNEKSIKKYKVNKIYYKLHMSDEMEEDIDEE